MEIQWWIAFNLFVVLFLALDLGVFHRKQEAVSVKNSFLWSLFWIFLAMLFNGFLYYWLGKDKALEFFTGYLIEKTLSIDNIFVFVMLFGYFKIPEQYQHRVLFWGIFGALIMRAIFIFAGVALLDKFHWMIYVFGALLIWTGWKMAFRKEEPMDFSKHPLTKLISKFVPFTDQLHGNRFFVRIDGRRFATPLFLTLLLVELTDVIFAVDSIPAILAITNDSFIVYTSNVFAILGLRSLFFALSGMMHKFRYLHYGLAIVLMFVGVKMVGAYWYKVPIEISLLVIFSVLALTIYLSQRKRK